MTSQADIVHHQSSTPTVMIADKQDAERFAHLLHGLLVALTQHLKLETEHLIAGTWSSLTADTETKSELLFAYRESHTNLTANKDAISRFVPVQLDELRRLHEAFQTELQRNLATVSTARAVSENLLSRLADQVSVKRQPKTYGASGTMNTAPKAAAIALDRAL